MVKTAIIGAGMIPVGEHWGTSLRELAGEAIHLAWDDAGKPKLDALYVANAYGSTLNQQTHLGALIADFIGLSGIEAHRIEAGEASGGVALRTAHMAVASGLVETALVVGVEKVTDLVGPERIRARSVDLDADYEMLHGATLQAMAGLLMRRYMHEYGLDLSHFEAFSVNAHANGKRNPLAMYRNTVREGAFAKAPMVADPVNLFDSAPDADGAAAVIITQAERAPDMVGQPVYVGASAVATDRFMLPERPDLLTLKAVSKSVDAVFAQSGLNRRAISFFELHDSFTVMSALALESAGFAERGEGWTMAQSGAVSLDGTLPISTFGGLKSRGNPAGATGLYQAVEAVTQLRGMAEDNQVSDATVGLIQNMGGLASTVATHILHK